MKSKVIAIVGPTASGKTALSVSLAERINGEIISCDSMQIYKEMDIGTAKPTADEMRGIKHHLIDFVEPTVDFSCADYSELAKSAVCDVVNKGKTPVFCGGTGLYVDHVLGNTSFSEAGRDEEYRKHLLDIAEAHGVEFLFTMLEKIDPESSEKTHPNNVKRVIRALEIYHVTGKTKSFWDKESQKMPSPYDSRIVCLDFKDREVLYDRINRRVEVMVAEGLIGEVESLLNRYGEGLSATSRQAIGYKELIEYFEGRCSLDEAIELIKKNSRNYAKRQLTWFRKHATRIYVDDCLSFDEIVNNAEKLIAD